MCCCFAVAAQGLIGASVRPFGVAGVLGFVRGLPVGLEAATYAAEAPEAAR